MTDRDTDPVTIVAIVGSPASGGRTLTAVHAALEGAEAAGASTSVIELGTLPDPAVVRTAAERANGILFASPVYGGSHSALLKSALEQIDRGMHGAGKPPLRGKSTGFLLTGGSAHHFLAGDDLRSVLAGFFAAQVLSPGIYLHAAHYTQPNELTPEGHELAASYGRALTGFTNAVSSVPAIAQLHPLA